MTGLATCADCGSSYFKERSVRPLCAHCEAADDAFRELMAERVRAERAWEATDLDELRAERDRLRPVDLPAKSQTTTSSGPGYELRWFRTGFGFALRRVEIPAQVERDAWGAPVR